MDAQANCMQLNKMTQTQSDPIVPYIRKSQHATRHLVSNLSSRARSGGKDRSAQGVLERTVAQAYLVQQAPLVVANKRTDHVRLHQCRRPSSERVGLERCLACPHPTDRQATRCTTRAMDLKRPRRTAARDKAQIEGLGAIAATTPSLHRRVIWVFFCVTWKLAEVSIRKQILFPLCRCLVYRRPKQEIPSEQIYVLSTQETEMIPRMMMEILRVEMNRVRARILALHPGSPERPLTPFVPRRMLLLHPKLTMFC